MSVSVGEPLGGTRLLGIPSAHLLAISLFYLAAHGGILLIPNAIYWDDWILWNVDFGVIIDTFRQLGSVFNLFGYLHVALLKAGPWIYRVLTFILVLGSGLFLYRLLEAQKWLQRDHVLLIVIMYLIAPLYAARVALIDFPYTLSLFLFFAAWYATGRNRPVALVLFALSFNTQSLLVFYALPIADWYFRENGQWRMGQALKWASRRLDFMLLPFAWFLVKIVFFKPTGLYEGYNEHFSLVSLAKSPLWQVKDLFRLNQPVFLLAFALALSIFLVRRLNVPLSGGGAAPRRKYLVIGLVALVAGLFPYWIVGYVPTFSEWASRHQLLMPLGMAIVVLGICVNWDDKLKYLFLALAFSLSIAMNWTNYIQLFMDWQKQKRVVEFLKASPLVAEAKLVLFDDETPNALSRAYRFYEWNGMLKLAHPDKPGKFGIGSNELDAYRQGSFDDRFTGHYNAEGHRREDQKPVVVLIRGTPFKQAIDIKPQ